MTEPVKTSSEARRRIGWRFWLLGLLVPSICVALGLAASCVDLLSPKVVKDDSTDQTSQTTTQAESGGTATSVTFQGAGWGVGAIGLLLGGMEAARRRRRDRSMDVLIRAIENSHQPGSVTKSIVASYYNSLIDRRVACLSKKHGWGSK